MRERSFLTAPGRQALAALTVGAVLGVLGPFGSFEHVPAVVRVPVWVGLVAVNWLLVLLLGEALCRLPVTGRWPVPLLSGLAGLAVAVPGTLVAYRAAQAMGPFELIMPSPLVFFGYVAVLGVAISVAAALHFDRPAAGRPGGVPPAAPTAAAPDPGAPDPGAEADPPGGSPFLVRIPPHLGRELLAVETEDHYLRIHTAAGSGLVLMRMRDAVAELAPLDGMRVHRSWWVARTAVERAARTGGGLTLTLRGGITVPVARTQRRAVRDWMDG